MGIFVSSSSYIFFRILVRESPEVAARQPLGLVKVLNWLSLVSQSPLRSDDVAFLV